MSIQAVLWVLEHSEATLGSRLVMVAIANHVDKAGRDSCPSISTIAAETKMSERHVKRVLPILARNGEISISRGAGVRGTNLFTLLGMQILLPNGRSEPASDHPLGWEL